MGLTTLDPVYNKQLADLEHPFFLSILETTRRPSDNNYMSLHIGWILKVEGAK